MVGTDLAGSMIKHCCSPLFEIQHKWGLRILGSKVHAMVIYKAISAGSNTSPVGTVIRARRNSSVG